jgi:hypothetical protein
MAEPLHIGRPETAEASPFHFGYINQVVGEDILSILEAQRAEADELFATFDESTSLYRYAPDKWSVREMLNHITDTERIFTFRALWFARGIDGALLSFDQDTAAAGAEADTIPFAAHLEEFRRVRLATLSLFANLPPAAWSRAGVASDHRVTVRALAFMVAGHLEHHLKITRALYLSQ